MTKLTIASLSFIFLVSLPQAGRATNYHEYKKFGPFSQTGKDLRRCHAWPKERWKCWYPDKTCGATRRRAHHVSAWRR